MKSEKLCKNLFYHILLKINIFDNNVFQGGTALRILYGLKRYSKDLDFTMKENE
jgi:predicted nucleotidyltransferase component of viral defense system